MATKARFMNDLEQEFAQTEEVEWTAMPGLCRHQIDAGKSTTGSLAVSIDFGTGYREVATIDFTDATRLPYVVEGKIKDIKVVPTGAGATGYTISYASNGVV